MNEDITILLVEVETVEAMDIKNTLESFGYKVPYVADGGNEAVLKALELKPDLILMDLFLRDEMNGMEVANKIKDLQIPVIFLTAHSEELTVKKAIKTKPYAYLLKPFETVELKFTIELVLNKSKIEKQLRKSVADYTFLTEKMNDIIWTRDLNLKTTYASTSIKKVLGFTPEERLKQDVQEQLTPESLVIAQSKLAKELTREEHGPKDQRRTFQIELEYYHKDGTTRWLENVITGIRNEKGDIIGLHGVSRDITQRKKAEDELKQSEKKFRSLIYNSTDLIRILDKDGIIIFDSPSSERILGFPEGYFLGKSPLEFIHPGDQQRVKEDLEDVYDNINPGIPTEFRILKADGDYISVESIAQNMTDVPGIEGIVITTHPIQQRKEMEDALRESEEKYRTLFEEDPNLTMLIGIDGVILEVNKAITNLGGLSKKEFVGKDFSKLDVISPEDMRLYYGKISRLLEGKDVKPFESRFKDIDGNIHWILIHLRPVMKNRNIIYILGIGSDITEQKIAENEIKASLDEKNILLQEVHHRVKNNMQIISSLLNLQKRYVDEEEAIDVLMESQNRVKSMAIIHEKLYQSNDLTRINFIDYIQSLVSNLFYSYNIKIAQIKPILKIENINLNMETAIPCGLIISELISNSLKYAFPNRKKGEIFVSLKSVDNNYELIISDNGIGLPEDLDFNNLESLGLSLVNNLTEQIDGELKINRNHGTEFNITFKELEYKERI